MIGVLAAIAAACGGGSGNTFTGTGSTTTPIASAAANVATAVVNAGPANTVNTLFTTVKICAPGSTTNCQTIDGIEIDTGSSGLRVLASVLSSSVSLPIQTDSNGNSVAECVQYVDGYNWGPVASADVTIAGESATSLPVQVVGDPNFATVPQACSSTGPAEDTLQTFGANGILGVSVFAQDCGEECAQTTDAGFYYVCSSGTQCSPATLALANQVQNPVTYFALDNNGVILQMPSVAAGGAVSVTGALIFGVDTQSNNASGATAKVFTLDPNTGNLTTQFNGQSLGESFFDTGSTGIYFTDSNLPACTDGNNQGFYCPTSTMSLSATVVGLNAVTEVVSFSVADADSLGANDPSLVAFSNLAGTNSMSGSFDWGMPFFFGREVYTVFENKSSSLGSGPYIAF
jgi:hypothetical protein